MAEELSFFSFARGQQYYVDTRRKWIDFLAGFFGTILAGIILFSMQMAFLLGVLFVQPLAILFLVSIGCAFFYDRKWLGIGAIAFLVMVLLAVIVYLLLGGDFYQ